MNTKGILSRLSRTAACIALAAGAAGAGPGHQDRLQRRPVRVALGAERPAAVLGLKTAIEDINAAGGLLGRKVVLVVRDDLSQPPKSIQNMTDLIDNEKVVAVFGPTIGQRAGLEAHSQPEEGAGDGRHRFGHRHHQAHARRRRQLHVPRRHGRPRTGRGRDRLPEAQSQGQERGLHDRDHRLRPERARTWRKWARRRA